MLFKIRIARLAAKRVVFPVGKDPKEQIIISASFGGAEYKV